MYTSKDWELTAVHSVPTDSIGGNIHYVHFGKMRVM